MIIITITIIKSTYKWLNSKVNVKLSNAQLKNLKSAVNDNKQYLMEIIYSMNYYWQGDKKQS